jgi:hypothetical protein
MDFLTENLRGALSVYVNNQSNWYKNAENPLAVHEVPLQDLKVWIRYAVSVEVSYFNETLNSERYVLHQLAEWWWNLLGHFMRDNIAAYIVVKSVGAVDVVLDSEL